MQIVFTNKHLSDIQRSHADSNQGNHVLFKGENNKLSRLFLISEIQSKHNTGCGSKKNYKK